MAPEHLIEGFRGIARMGLVVPPDLLSATPDGSPGRLSSRFVVEDGDGQAVAGLGIEQVIGRADPRGPAVASMAQSRSSVGLGPIPRLWQSLLLRSVDPVPER